jgi:hypothetical protein
VAIALGSLATVRNVRVQGGYDVGFAVSGNCASVLGCAAEDNNTAVRVGWGPVGGGVLARFPLSGVQFSMFRLKELTHSLICIMRPGALSADTSRRNMQELLSRRAELPIWFGMPDRRQW